MNSNDTLLRKTGRLGACVVAVGGTTIIAGWQFRIPFLRGEIFNNFVAPNTALLMVACGISLLLLSSERKPQQIVGTILAVPVLLFALAVLFERLTNVDLGIDRVFMAHRLSDWVGVPQVGRFSTTTAINFIFVAFSLLTLRLPSKVPFSDYFAAATATVCYFAIVGYLYKASLLYGRITSSSTIALFVVMTLSLWCSSPKLRFARFVTGDLAGSILARRVVVAILFLMPLLGWIEIEARRVNVLDREYGIAIFVVASATIFTVLVLRTARVLDAIDRRRSQAEAVLIQTEKLAAAGRMAATIAHEINNPLGALTNLLYLSRNKDTGEEIRDSYLEMAEQEVRRVALISKQTLGFYRESSAPTNFPPGDFLKQVAALYQTRIANKGIDIKVEVDGSRNIFGIEGEIRQVMVNLVANAVDACPLEGGMIRIAAGEEAEKIAISVSDNGHGVSEADRAHIFEAFFTTKESVGTGLGLWVSKGLVEKNGGKIALISDTEGPFKTTFRLTLPAADAEQEFVPKDETETSSSALTTPPSIEPA